MRPVVMAPHVTDFPCLGPVCRQQVSCRQNQRKPGPAVPGKYKQDQGACTVKKDDGGVRACQPPDQGCLAGGHAVDGEVGIGQDKVPLIIRCEGDGAESIHQGIEGVCGVPVQRGSPVGNQHAVPADGHAEGFSGHEGVVAPGAFLAEVAVIPGCTGVVVQIEGSCQADLLRSLVVVDELACPFLFLSGDFFYGGSDLVAGADLGYVDGGELPRRCRCHQEGQSIGRECERDEYFSCPG